LESEVTVEVKEVVKAILDKWESETSPEAKSRARAIVALANSSDKRAEELLARLSRSSPILRERKQAANALVQRQH
jgi:hypothetical protein